MIRPLFAANFPEMASADLLDGIGARMHSPTDWARLALLALDQAGLPPAAQEAIEEIVNDHVEVWP